MKKYFAFLSAFCLFFVSPLLLAQIYYWEDQNGAKYYFSSLPESREGIRNFKVYSTAPEVEEIKTNTPSSNHLVASSQKTLPKGIIDTTSWCGYCKKAKA